jgi:hypothetical protein
MIIGTIIGAKVRLKNGNPTDSFGPFIASRNSGYRVPRNTVAQPQDNNRLLRTRAPSREIGANRPPPFSVGARKAYRVSDPPIAVTSSSKMNVPRSGSVAKACTEVKTPDRTRKVPTKDKEKVMIASRMVQAFRVSRFSTTIEEWISAVPTSQGMKLAFSTGSQNHQPPQPSV